MLDVVSHSFRTRDPEKAHAFLAATYAANKMRMQGCREEFALAHDHRGAGSLDRAVLTYRMPVHHEVEPLGRLLVARVVDGRLERTTSGETHRFTAGDVFLVAAADRPYAIRWEDVTIELMNVDLGVLAEVADQTATRRRPAPRFTATTARTERAGRQLSRVMDLVSGHLTQDEQVPAILADSTARTLGAAVLSTFANTLVDEPPAAAVSPDRRVVRLASEHIEGGAHRPMSVREIAEAAHVAPRTLQLAFRRHLGMTPTEYLRRVRLDRAHQELLDADPGAGATVTDIALRWGFHHPSRFAATYRRTYGRTPRETLHR